MELPTSVIPTATSSVTPLRLAVVGHTNTGKTSLLRTLTRDSSFGEVRNSPGTTRHVEGVRIKLAENELIELFDTPGMEDSMALLDYLLRIESEESHEKRLDEPQRIALFLQTPEATERFEQEARVLRQLLQSDAALYVIDVRDPVLAKHKDELRILAYCGKPLLPVLNFVVSPEQRTQEWRLALANLGLHASAEFDTVAPTLNGEAQLYEKLALLVSEKHSEQLRNLSLDVETQRQQRLADAWRLLAELLIDVAAWRLISSSQKTIIEQNIKTLHETIRTREEKCVKSLLRRFNFSLREYLPDHIALEGYRWETDLFHPEVMKELGVQVGKGVAAGAMAGATFDLLTAGLSLGAGTLVGAAAGGLWQGVDKWGQRLMGKWRGESELTVDDSVIRALALRQTALIEALAKRGHASQAPISIPNSKTALELGITENNEVGAKTAINWRSGSLPEPLQQARAFPQWSVLDPKYAPSLRRDQAVTALTGVLAGKALVNTSSAAPEAANTASDVSG